MNNKLEQIKYDIYDLLEMDYLEKYLKDNIMDNIIYKKEKLIKLLQIYSAIEYLED